MGISPSEDIILIIHVYDGFISDKDIVARWTLCINWMDIDGCKLISRIWEEGDLCISDRDLLLQMMMKLNM